MSKIHDAIDAFINGNPGTRSVGETMTAEEAEAWKEDMQKEEHNDPENLERRQKTMKKSEKRAAKRMKDRTEEIQH